MLESRHLTTQDWTLRARHDYALHDVTLHERDTTGHGVTGLEPTGSHDTRPDTSHTGHYSTFQHFTPRDAAPLYLTLHTPNATRRHIPKQHTSHTSRDHTDWTLRLARHGTRRNTSRTRPDETDRHLTEPDTSQTERGGTPRKKQRANGASPLSQGTDKAERAR